MRTHGRVTRFVGFSMVALCGLAFAARWLPFDLPTGIEHSGRPESAARSPSTVDTSLPPPRLFAEGTISTSKDEAGITFTPDGKTAYFGIKAPSTWFPPLFVICVSHYQDGRWSAPEVAPFSGQYSDFYPAISPDGSKFFFASTRPTEGKPKRDFDLWVMQKTPAGWSEPRNLGAPVNSPAQEIGPSVAADGTLYFSTIRPGGKRTYGIYRSRLADGKYTEPESLGDAINTENGEIDPCIAPDQSFLVFVSAGRKEELVGVHAAYSQGDLYISYNQNGAWTSARHLPTPINSGAVESAPSLSPDGRYLFFSSERGFATYRPPRPFTYKELVSRQREVLNGLGNIYRVDLRTLQER